jgi:hypothetical protein
VTLALHEWGDPGEPRIVCLHGVCNHGRHFAPLAARLSSYHVLAPDLLEVVVVPGGHTVTWDALEETSAAIAAFLAR